MIEILVLQALAHHARGDAPSASAFLERAVTMAEPEGYVRVFTEAGPAVAVLLRTAAKQAASRDYARLLCPARAGPGPAARRARP